MPAESLGSLEVRVRPRQRLIPVAFDEGAPDIERLQPEERAAIADPGRIFGRAVGPRAPLVAFIRTGAQRREVHERASRLGRRERLGERDRLVQEILCVDELTVGELRCRLRRQQVRARRSPPDGRRYARILAPGVGRMSIVARLDLT